MSDPRTAAEREQMAATEAAAGAGELVVSTACPGCAARFALLVRAGYRARPTGSYSIAGAQPKVVARRVSLLRCIRCDWTGEGLGA